MKTLNIKSVFALLLILNSVAFANAQSTIVVDGNNCTHGEAEWPATANVVDSKDPVGVPGTSDINRFWGKAIGDTAYFAFTRELAVIGDASFAIHIDSDGDTTTGDLANGGADKALFLSISNNNIINSVIYNWTSASGGKYVSSLVGVKSAIGDSTCANSTYNFFEIGVPLADLVDDVCNINSSGGVTLTSASTFSGTSLNSSSKDVMSLNLFIYINDKPEVDVHVPSDYICSGATITLDASASRADVNGNSGIDSIATIEWDFDYSGVFTVDSVGTTVSPTYFQASDSSLKNIAVRVTDAWGCMDTLDDIQLVVTALPNLSASYTVDRNFNKCENYIWNYEVNTSTDYRGNSLSDFSWELADDSIRSGAQLSYTYSSCFWTLSGDKAAVVTGTDINGCAVTVNLSKPVPVEFLEVTANNGSNNEVIVAWSTASEMNNEYFVVERKLEGEMEFVALGTVLGAGNSMEIINYTFADMSNPGHANAYYRIKQIDYDGQFEYSETVLVKKEHGMSVSVYPNPSSDYIKITADNKKYSIAQVELLNSAGQVVKSTEGVGEISFSIIDLEPGIYFVKYELDGQLETARVIKQN